MLESKMSSVYVHKVTNFLIFCQIYLQKNRYFSKFMTICDNYAAFIRFLCIFHFLLL